MTRKDKLKALMALDMTTFVHACNQLLPLQDEKEDNPERWKPMAARFVVEAPLEAWSEDWIDPFEGNEGIYHYNDPRGVKRTRAALANMVERPGPWNATRVINIGLAVASRASLIEGSAYLDKIIKEEQP